MMNELMILFYLDTRGGKIKINLMPAILNDILCIDKYHYCIDKDLTIITRWKAN